MKRRVLWSFVLVTFVNYLMGCYGSTQVSNDEVSFEDDKITQVVLRSGEAVDFDDHGGRLSRGTTISGRTEKGVHRVIRIDAISQFRTSRVPSVPVGEIGTRTVVEVVNVNDHLFRFDDSGGRYDATTGMIKGRQEGAGSFEIAADLMKRIRTVKPEALSRAEFLSRQPLSITEVVTIEGDARHPMHVLVVFDTLGGAFDTGGVPSIAGGTTDGRYMQFRLDEVVNVEVERTDVVGTLFATLGGGMLLLTLIFSAGGGIDWGKKSLP